MHYETRDYQLRIASRNLERLKQLLYRTFLQKAQAHIWEGYKRELEFSRRIVDYLLVKIHHDAVSHEIKFDREGRFLYDMTPNQIILMVQAYAKYGEAPIDETTVERLRKFLQD